MFSTDLSEFENDKLYTVFDQTSRESIKCYMCRDDIKDVNSSITSGLATIKYAYFGEGKMVMCATELAIKTIEDTNIIIIL